MPLPIRSSVSGLFRRASNSRGLARLGGARAQAALLSILNFKLAKAITTRPAAAHQLAVLPVAEGAGHVLASTADHGGKVVLADLLTDEEIIAQAKRLATHPEITAEARAKGSRVRLRSRHKGHSRATITY